MNFLIFASAIARAKIMRIHSHEWKFVTLIFENQLNYDVIRGYKKNKEQQTTTDKQTIQTTTQSRMSWYRSEQKLRTRDVDCIAMAIEEQKLTINFHSRGNKINSVIQSPPN